MRIAYIIPEAIFFSAKNRGGQVSHAMNLAKSLKCHSDLTLFGHESLLEHDPEVPVKVVNSRYTAVARLTFPLRLLIAILKMGKFDMVLIRKSAFALMWIPLYKLLLSGKIVLEVNGLSRHNQNGVATKPIIFLLLSFFHKLAFLSCDGIYTVTNTLRKDVMESYGIKPEKIAVIPNGSTPLMSVTKSTGVTLNVLFFGVFQPYNNFELLMAAAESMPHINFSFIGYGACEKIITDSLLPNVKMHGPMSPKELAKSGIITDRTIGIIPMRDSDVALNGSPVKLYDYLAMSLPILASSNTDTLREVGSLSCIFFYNVDDLVSLQRSIEDCNNEAHEIVKSFDFEKVTRLNSWDKRALKLINSF